MWEGRSKRNTNVLAYFGVGFFFSFLNISLRLVVCIVGFLYIALCALYWRLARQKDGARL